MESYRIATALQFYGAPILRDVAKMIRYVTDDTQLLAREMADIMYGLRGVGLAGNQVGIDHRIIVVDFLGSPRVMLNPTIIEESKEKRKLYEGCLSLPGIERAVVRSTYIKVRYMDLEGKTQTLELFPKEPRDAPSHELVSRIIQHEVDHLDGVLIIDKE